MIRIGLREGLMRINVFKDTRRCASSSLLLVGALFASLASGQALTGNDLQVACRETHYTLGTPCLAYIRGVIEGATAQFAVHLEGANNLFDMAAVEMNRPYCVPADVSWDQTVDIVASYLNKNPETRHHGAPVIIWRAINQAFPCPLASGRSR